MSTEVVKEVIKADYEISITGMPMGLAILFNDKLYARCKEVALRISGAEGFTPPHLIGKPEACFAVVTRAITWKLDPQAVAQSTYQTPGGRVGYEGKLVQAILENSGKLVGPVKYEHYGEWDKIKGKFEVKSGPSGGKPYPQPTWTRADVKGLGVTVSAQVKGELERRSLNVDLDEMFPLNSTLWATRPKQQICYTACRAFANVCAPGLMMGEPFDVDQDAGAGMRDITPARPVLADFQTTQAAPAPAPAAAPAPATEDVTEVIDNDTGEVRDAADDPENPVPEFSAADAFEIGKADHAAGKSLHNVPDEWRGHPDAQKFIDARAEGWRDADNAKTKAAKAGTKK